MQRPVRPKHVHHLEHVSRISRLHGAKPVISEGPHIHFSATEIASILVSMITLFLAFHMFGVSDSGIVVGVVLGITLHEVGHKLVAQFMGFESRYKLWEIGIVLVLAIAIITRGKFIFAAPGFVVTEGNATARECGWISLSAPATNIILAIFFFMFTGALAMSAAYVNILLAIFNLLPVPPLDGAAVMEWSPSMWSLAFGISIVLGVVFFL